MKMRVPAQHVSERLMGNNHCGLNIFSGSFFVKFSEYTENQAGNICKKFSVVPEKDPQGFWNSEDKLSMRQFQKYIFCQMLCQKYSPFLTAGWAKIKPFTAERSEVIMAAFRVCTADPCHTIQIITTGSELFADFLNALKTEFTVFVRILFLINIAEIAETFLENSV